MQVSLEASCPWLALRWSRDSRGTHPTEDNACYLWEECGVPPDVVQYCAGLLPWHGERFVPVPVETQWSVCLTTHYGSCRWLRERQWYQREPALVCPLVGSRSDRQHKYLYPCALNVCHARQATAGKATRAISDVVHTLLVRRGPATRAKASGMAISAEKQKSLCLTRRHVECELYQLSLPG